jgi:putative flippase GtrA
MPPALPAPRGLGHQLTAFALVGAVAFVVHYGVLIALVEGFGVGAVAATLVGFVAGGWVSYLLNRRHTYASDRPHAEASPRFGAVALVGFGLTWLLMSVFTGRLGLPYLPAQLATTGLVLIWSFGANRLWTFAER